MGITVHTAARIMAAAHGGQVLISADTARLAATDPSLSRQSLGEFSLRGLTERHELIQVDADDLMSDFPPSAV